MVLHNTTLVPSLGLCIGPACEADLSAGMRRERVSPQIRKKKERRHTSTKCACSVSGRLSFLGSFSDDFTAVVENVRSIYADYAVDDNRSSTNAVRVGYTA